MTVFDYKCVYGLAEAKSSNVLKKVIPRITDKSFWKQIYCNFQVRHRVINLRTEL